MKNGNGYKVVLTNSKGEVYDDSKVFKTLKGATARLSTLVMSEELRLMAGFGAQSQYHIAKC